MKRKVGWSVLSLLAALSMAGCTSVGIGLSLPIGGLGGISVGVNSDGRVSGGVSVGSGGVSVGVGGTAQLPPPASAASAASSPAHEH